MRGGRGVGVGFMIVTAVALLSVPASGQPARSDLPPGGFVVREARSGRVIIQGRVQPAPPGAVTIGPRAPAPPVPRLAAPLIAAPADATEGGMTSRAAASPAPVAAPLAAPVSPVRIELVMPQGPQAPTFVNGGVPLGGAAALSAPGLAGTTAVVVPAGTLSPAVPFGERAPDPLPFPNRAVNTANGITTGNVGTATNTGTTAGTGGVRITPAGGGVAGTTAPTLPPVIQFGVRSR